MPQAGKYQFEPLGHSHDRAAFSCGVQALDRYLRSYAKQDVDRRLAAVFVLVDTEKQIIAGYYTLSAFTVEPTSLPEELARRLPKRPIPTTLLGRLAVDTRYQGQGLGELLLLDALHRAYAAHNQVGSMAVVVDAKDARARSFYEKYGFQRFASDDLRLFIPMNTIESLDT